jgi:hypothetical protein
LIRKLSLKPAIVLLHKIIPARWFTNQTSDVDNLHSRARGGFVRERGGETKRVRETGIIEREGGTIR